MRTVKDFFGIQGPDCGSSGPFVDNDVLIGVEVETEGCGRSVPYLQERLSTWVVKTDGSLKSAQPYELVLDSPQKGQMLYYSLYSLDKVMSKTRVTYPHNTSVHVHVDVSNLDVEQTRNFLYLAISLESALVQYSGNRRNNIFCMPHGQSNGAALRSMGYKIGVNSAMPLTDPHSHRYSTVNFSPMSSFGSVEFRMHEGTHDKDRLIRWINVLLSLRTFALSVPGDPEAVDKLCYASSGKDLVSFMRQIWDKDVVDAMLHKDLHRHVIESSIKARLSLFPKQYDEFEEWEYQVASSQGFRK